MLKHSICLFVFLVLICNEHDIAFATQETDTTKTQDSAWDPKCKELYGYFEAAFANASAIRSFDCLIHFRDDYDSVAKNPKKLNLNGAITKNIVWQRLRVDLDKQRASISRRRHFESTDLSLPDPKTGKPGLQSVVRFSWGTCVNGQTDQLFQYRNGSLTEEVAGDYTLEQQMVKHGIPDPRGLGWSGVLNGSTYSDFKVWTTAAKAGHHLLELRGSSNKLLKIRKYTSPKKETAKYYTDFELDPNTNNIHRSHSFEIDPNETRRITITNDFRTEWIEMNGVQLPSKVTVTGLDPRRIGRADKHQWGRIRKVYTFHWFSVNEIIEDSAFDGSEFEDETRFNGLVDPVKTGAKPLVDLLEQVPKKVED
jgi:hypothetical protein